MQVLIKNPYYPANLASKGLIESFWSDKCFSIGENFDFGAYQIDTVELSPFLSIDARVAITSALLVPQKSCYARGLGSLGILAAFFMTQGKFKLEEDPQKLSPYLKEYIPQEVASFLVTEEPFEQVVVFGENFIPPDLWSKLKVGGFFILASTKGAIKVDLIPGDFEAFGKLWPYGEPTEFGWRFKEAQWGLGGFEFVKLKKLK